MPIGIQVWLYECNSSIDIQVAKKVDVHIPKLLNWQTVEIKPKYKKLMNTIFIDVNNKFKFSNITPTPRELAVLQLPSVGIENQVEDPIKTTSKDFDIPRASESEVQVWMKELLDFRKETINNLDGIDSKTVEHETINNSDDIGSKTDDNEVVCLKSPVRNLIKVDDVFSAPRPIVSTVPQPSFAFDIPQKAVPEVSEEAHELPQVSEEAHEMPQVSKEAHELPQVSEEAHEHAEEQFTCLVPIQSVDPMNVTTHS
ncbi:hypothetical protein KY289_009614 [Solanum tuberosum]|nr:hypothetical protein KY289_009614 [Solanum tuberosum]